MKAGDKRVFRRHPKSDPLMNCPPEGQIVTIEHPCQCNCGDHYKVVGWETDLEGNPQVFHSSELLPLQDNFAEETLAKAKEQQKEYNIPTIDPVTREPIKI